MKKKQALEKHLKLLLKFVLELPKENFVITDRTYDYDFCVGAIEDAEDVEKKAVCDIDWCKIKKDVEYFTKKLNVNFAGFKKKSCLEFTVDLFEQHYVYNEMYPNSPNNPFAPLYELVKDADCLIDIKFVQPILPNQIGIAVMSIWKKDGVFLTTSVIIER